MTGLGLRAGVDGSMVPNLMRESFRMTAPKCLTPLLDPN